MLKSMRLGIVAAATLALWTGTQAGDEKGHGSDKDHVLVRPDEIKWGPSPSALPPIIPRAPPPQTRRGGDCGSAAAI
jgi:hypothetical protein